jgi:hypothetical protein
MNVILNGMPLLYLHLESNGKNYEVCMNAVDFFSVSKSKYIDCDIDVYFRYFIKIKFIPNVKNQGIKCSFL